MADPHAHDNVHEQLPSGAIGLMFHGHFLQYKFQLGRPSDHVPCCIGQLTDHSDSLVDLIPVGLICLRDLQVYYLTIDQEIDMSRDT